MAEERGLRHYLVRHGEAKSELEDPAKPLSDRGREQVERVARHAAALGVEVAEIHHSARLRARQTAETLALHLSPRRGIREAEGLAPGDEPERARIELETAQEPLMLVGHLPHLNRLASALLLGGPERDIIRLEMGAIVCLDKTDAGFRLVWILTPELTRISA